MLSSVDKIFKSKSVYSSGGRSEKFTSVHSLQFTEVYTSPHFTVHNISPQFTEVHIFGLLETAVDCCCLLWTAVDFSVDCGLLCTDVDCCGLMSVQCSFVTREGARILTRARRKLLKHSKVVGTFSVMIFGNDRKSSEHLCPGISGNSQTIERFRMTFMANGKRQIHVYVFSKYIISILE